MQWSTELDKPIRKDGHKHGKHIYNPATSHTFESKPGSWKIVYGTIDPTATLAPPSRY